MAAARFDTKYVDVPELLETFSDHVEKFFFDGHTLRIEFCVKRVDETGANNMPTGKRYPSCRLVLQQEAAIDLMNKLQGMAAAMEKQGILKRGAPPSSPQSAAI